MEAINGRHKYYAWLLKMSTELEAAGYTTIYLEAEKRPDSS